MAKREIAHYEQFILLPKCFQKSSTAEASQSVSFWERVHKWVNRYSGEWYRASSSWKVRLEKFFVYKQFKDSHGNIFSLLFQLSQLMKQSATTTSPSWWPPMVAILVSWRAWYRKVMVIFIGCFLSILRGYLLTDKNVLKLNRCTMQTNQKPFLCTQNLIKS